MSFFPLSGSTTRQYSYDNCYKTLAAMTGQSTSADSTRKSKMTVTVLRDGNTPSYTDRTAGKQTSPETTHKTKNTITGFSVKVQNNTIPIKSKPIITQQTCPVIGS